MLFCEADYCSGLDQRTAVQEIVIGFNWEKCVSAVVGLIDLEFLTAGCS